MLVDQSTKDLVVLIAQCNSGECYKKTLRELGGKCIRTSLMLLIVLAAGGVGLLASSI